VATVLVDGENVRRSVWPNIGRDELEDRSRAWAREHGHEVVVAWEGFETADDTIAREVRQRERPLWVVTSDRELRHRVAGYAERVIGGGSFARQL
jgi:predicted RNA-binding protein with PIN domain